MGNKVDGESEGHCNKTKQQTNFQQVFKLCRWQPGQYLKTYGKNNKELHV